jgi:hypothetical protein
MADGQMSGGSAGPFALIQPFLSGESAQDKLRDYYNRQALANAGAVAGDPNAPFSGEFATPPVASAKPPPMGIAPPGPNEPKSTQIPESYGSLLMDLQQQNEAAAGFNRSIGLGLSAFAQPRDRESMIHAFDPAVPPADPFKMGESIMNQMSMQQGQDRSNQIARLVNDPKQGPLIAQKMGMDWGALKVGIVADPGMIGKIATVMGTPTDMMRNASQIAIQMKAAGAPQEAIDRTVSLVQTGMLPDVARPMAMAEIAWKRDNPNKPLPWTEGDPASFARYNTTVAAREDQRQEALGKRPGVDQKLGNIEQQLDEISKNPALPGLMEKMTPTTGSWSIIATGPAERALAQQIDQLASEKYVEGLSDPNMGNRKTQTEMTYVGKALSGVLNARNLKLPDFQAGLERLKEQVKETHANAYGESGDFTGMNPELNGYLNDAYRKGPLSEGIKNAPQRVPLDDEAKTYWANGLKAGTPKSTMIHILRRNNYDTSSLQPGM